MTAAFDQKVQAEGKKWVPATPLDAIKDPPLRCRVKENGDKSEWKESTLVGWDRSDEYQWGVADPMIQWAKVCEVWKEPESDSRTFRLIGTELAKADAFADKHRASRQGAIGGQFTYCFTPTSIGLVIEIRDNNTEATEDVTDYELF